MESAELRIQKWETSSATLGIQILQARRIISCSKVRFIRRFINRKETEWKIDIKGWKKSQEGRNKVRSEDWQSARAMHSLFLQYCSVLKIKNNNLKSRVFVNYAKNLDIFRKIPCNYYPERTLWEWSQAVQLRWRVGPIARFEASFAPEIWKCSVFGNGFTSWSSPAYGNPLCRNLSLRIRKLKAASKYRN